MIRLKAIIFTLLLSGNPSLLFSQTAGFNLKTFGYFETSFAYRKDLDGPVANKSFSMQQLNLFLQNHLSLHWTAFVNLEFVNSYSSFRNWGALDLEEAWVSYRPNNQFTLKLGLQIPIFNNLNEIKNRTPLLPYIIRPLVYESSFNEIIPLDEFIPARAFVQTNGFIPLKTLKFDYAVFIGNSPNINNDPRLGQTGVDTTKLFLVGGRVGLHTDNFKLGVSATFDHLDFSNIAVFFGYPPSDFRKTPRVRLGGDFSMNAGKFAWESEFVQVKYDDNYPQLNLDKKFYYGMVGCHLTDRFFAYGSYSVTRQNVLPFFDSNIFSLSAGTTYHANDMVVMKAQFFRLRFDNSLPVAMGSKSLYYYVALSVFF